MLTGKITTRPARESDLVKVCGDKAPVSMRAWCMDVDGEPVAVAGYFMTPAHAVVFSDISREDVPKMAIWRATKKFMEKIPNQTLCVTKGSQAFLERLGWVYHSTTDEGDVYLWQR